MKNNKMLPFLKWAGGKRWLSASKSTFFPKKFNRYIEPFLGSGAVFFELQPEQAILSDINKELIETYQAIKSDWEKVERFLVKHSKNHSSEYYYKLRGEKPRSLHGKAARFIYLNRTCWNGLYRVNLRGVFNVPIGTKKNVLLDTDNFNYISKLLRNTKILVADFEEIIQEADEGDLLFIDPPYTVKHNHNNFIKYNEKLFSWEDQIRLRDCLREAQKRHVTIIATNANHPSVKDLYKEFKYYELSRNSLIAADSKKRGSIQELLIKSE